MLSEKSQLILLEILVHQKITRNWLLKNTNYFYNSTDFFKHLKALKEFELVYCDGEKIDKNHAKEWRLTFKGQLRAKLIALDKNNPKDYRKNERNVILFEI